MIASAATSPALPPTRPTAVRDGTTHATFGPPREGRPSLFRPGCALLGADPAAIRGSGKMELLIRPGPLLVGGLPFSSAALPFSGERRILGASFVGLHSSGR